MEPLFRNSILFISGFVVALVLFRHPESIQHIKTYVEAEENAIRYNESTTSSLNTRQNPMAAPKNQDHSLTASSYRTRNASYGYQASSRPSLDSVPNIPDHVPTAPPTGRPEGEAENNENNEDENQKAQQAATQPQPSKSQYEAPHYKDIDSGEKSFSSTMPLVGAIVTDNTNKNTDSNTKNNTSNSGTAISGAGFGGTSKNPNTDTDNDSFDLDDDFSRSGLQSAKKLYNQKEITEDEYLGYLSSGLESSDASLKSLAVNELATIRSQNAFLLQSQFASASRTNEQALTQALVSTYRSSSDLIFLSQRISDDSSVVSQSWAVHVLDAVISGSNMDFSNPEIKNTLVNNISSSLVSLDANHPSFGLAQSISRDINQKLS